MRKAFINSLVRIAENDDRVFLITPDIGYSVLEVFREKFPKRFLNVGIAEQNAVSIASGLALSGLIPYVYTINPFVCMRPFEQVRLDVAYMNTNVRIVGVGAGFSYGAAGATHHSIEDIAIMRVLPNMTVICPGDPWEVEQAMLQSVSYQGPIFLRLGKQGEPVINSKLEKFEIGKSTIIRNGKDVWLFSTSNMLEISDNVCKGLNEHGIQAGLVSMHTIKPFDAETVLQIASSGVPVFSIEEHSVIGGMGSAIAEVLAESKYHPLFKRIGVSDRFSHFVGGHNFIRKKFNLDEKSILNEIIKTLNSANK